MTQQPNAGPAPLERGVRPAARQIAERLQLAAPHMTHEYDRAVFLEAAAELDRLTAALKKANDQAERFERGWYLRGDALEKVKDAVCGDRVPRWAGADATTRTRGWIADVCDAGLAA